MSDRKPTEPDRAENADNVDRAGDRSPSAGTGRRVKMVVIGLLIGVAFMIVKSLIVVVPDDEDGADEPKAETTAAAAVTRPGATAAPAAPAKAKSRTRVEIPDDITVLDIAGSADQLHSEDLGPLDDLLIVQSLIDAYRRIEGANPSGGLNFEIVARLTGRNDRKVAFISPDHPDLNAEGELVDRWGTPYWFHPITRERMEIISAGPDRSLFTDDDVKLE